jgi:hypothetical protein
VILDQQTVFERLCHSYKIDDTTTIADAKSLFARCYSNARRHGEHSNVRRPRRCVVSGPYLRCLPKRPVGTYRRESGGCRRLRKQRMAGDTAAIGWSILAR